MILSNPAINNILEAFGYFFYNDAILRKFLVIISTIIFIRTIANFLYKNATGTIFHTSFMPAADTVKGIEVYDLPFHKYEMYSLDIENLQDLSFALQKKLGKDWTSFCHATEVRLTTKAQTTSKVIALTYFFITRDALKYI